MKRKANEMKIKFYFDENVLMNYKMTFSGQLIIPHKRS